MTLRSHSPCCLFRGLGLSFQQRTTRGSQASRRQLEGHAVQMGHWESKGGRPSSTCSASGLSRAKVRGEDPRRFSTILLLCIQLSSEAKNIGSLRGGYFSGREERKPSLRGLLALLPAPEDSTRQMFPELSESIMWLFRCDISHPPICPSRRPSAFCPLQPVLPSPLTFLILFLLPLSILPPPLHNSALPSSWSRKLVKI